MLYDINISLILLRGYHNCSSTPLRCSFPNLLPPLSLWNTFLPPLSVECLSTTSPTLEPLTHPPTRPASPPVTRLTSQTGGGPPRGCLTCQASPRGGRRVNGCVRGSQKGMYMGSMFQWVILDQLHQCTATALLHSASRQKLWHNHQWLQQRSMGGGGSKGI